MTTGQMRGIAREHESNLDWDNAANCYWQAVLLYPRHDKNLGDLALTDLNNLNSRAINCAKMIGN